MPKAWKYHFNSRKNRTEYNRLILTLPGGYICTLPFLSSVRYNVGRIIERRLTIKCQAPKRRLCKKCAALDKQHTDAEKRQRGDGESKTTKPECALVLKNCSIWMLRFVKGTLRRLIQYVFVSSGSRESLWNILFARSFKVIKQANKLLGSMG